VDGGAWILANRNAKHLVREGPALAALHEAAAATPTVAIRETHSLEELAAAAREIAQKRGRAVILAGGDGTTMAGVTALIRAFAELGPAAAPIPPIALAPCGTVSTIAKNWSPRRPLEPRARAITRLVRAVADDRATRTARPALRVKDDRAETRTGFMFGTGLVAHFFHAYYDAPTQGLATAAALTLRIFTGAFVGASLARQVLTPMPARVTIDGRKRRPAAWSLVLASAVRDVGLHLLVTPRAGEDLARMHVVASPLGPLALGAQLPRVLAGRKLVAWGDEDENVDALATELTVVGQIPYVLDGELFRTQARVVVTPAPPVTILTA
jgi:diacylglycerol kinase family enzyme